MIDDNDRGAVRVEGSSFFAPSDVHDGPEGHEVSSCNVAREFSRDRHSTGASEGGESGTFWVSPSDPDESHGRDSVASSAVTVAISGSSPDWVADPLSLTFTRENWREAQPFTLSAVDDEVDELLEMHFAAISSHSSVALYDEHLPMSSRCGVAGIFRSEPNRGRSAGLTLDMTNRAALRRLLRIVCRTRLVRSHGRSDTIRLR